MVGRKGIFLWQGKEIKYFQNELMKKKENFIAVQIATNEHTKRKHVFTTLTSNQRERKKKREKERK